MGYIRPRKVIAGIVIVVIVMAIANWLLDKFPIWKWFQH